MEEIEKHPDDNEHTYRDWQRRILTVSWITYASFYLGKANIGPALPRIREFLTVDQFAVSPILAGFKFVYGIGQFVNGQIGDHVNPKYLIILGMVGSIVVNFFFGFGNAWGFLIVLWGINGFFQSTGWPPLVKILANWFPSSSRGNAMGIMSTSYQLGVSVSSILAGLLVGYKWRYAFWIPALLMSFIAVYFFISIKISPQEVDLASTNSYPKRSEDKQEPKGLRYTLRYTLTNPTLWIVAFSCAAINIVRYVYIDWWPSYITKTQGISINQATYQVSTVQIGGIVGSILIGWLADRFFGRKRSPIVLGTLASLGFFILIHSYIAQVSATMGIICLFLIGFTTYGPFAILTGADAQDLGGEHAVSSVTGFIDALSYIVASFGDIGIGWFAGRYGWQRLPIFWASVAFLAAVLIIPIWIKQYKK